jgi:YidC/Oxa1 family membrane protein insertase
MTRKDLIIVALLFALWIAWPVIDRQIIKRYFFPVPPAQATPEAVLRESETLASPKTAPPPSSEAEKPAEAVSPQTTPAQPDEEEQPEHTAVLENDHLRLEVSSRGGVIRSAVLKSYLATRDPASGPVTFDFSATPALAPADPLAARQLPSFRLVEREPGRVIELTRREADGVVWTRTLELTNNYMLEVRDRFENSGAATLSVPLKEVWSAPMLNMEGRTERGVVYLGADTLSPGGESVKHWGRKFPDWFRDERKLRQLPKLPVYVSKALDRPVDWVAAKNKYFAQIIVPDAGGENALFHVAREVAEAERNNPAAGPKTATPESVAVGVQFPDVFLGPSESQTLATHFYIGPKKYSELNRYAFHLVDVMEFGMWAPIGKVLLRILIAIHDHLWPHNYGVAIMLLTIIIRVVFWPITHKSTESMKRMQAIQPLLNEVRAKYKDNPQRMQQEMMALYKEHKVNPLAGCLPMLIQIPVFFALYVVLRSAIELRFSPFLWIADLSQPENLLADKLPIPLNILPIIMAVTMAWQQRLTPTGGDPNQQKMMMFMPVMLLFMFYNIASGLVLYWTTNQCLMIVQQLWMHRKTGGKPAVPQTAPAR